MQEFTKSSKEIKKSHHRYVRLTVKRELPSFEVSFASWIWETICLFDLLAGDPNKSRCVYLIGKVLNSLPTLI